MNCSQFRSAYSDFVDGLLDEVLEVRFHTHLAECLSCRRFDSALRRGLGALRKIHSPAPSGDFDRRLFDRIQKECAEPEPPPSAAIAVFGTVAILLVVGALGWEARAWMRPTPPAPPVASSARFDPRALRWAEGDQAPAYRNRFSVIPVRDDSTRRAERRVQPVELTVDWMAP